MSHAFLLVNPLSNQVQRGLQQVNLHITQTGFCKEIPKVDVKVRGLEKIFTTFRIFQHLHKYVKYIT
jgi:hypothetical protein